jgi:hypothetical protein
MWIKLRQWNRRLGCRGQTLVEYLLIVILALTFSRFIYFNEKFGVQPNFERTMIRLGSYLEGNLKSGTKNGEQGQNSNDAFAGTSTWTN